MEDWTWKWHLFKY